MGPGFTDQGIFKIANVNMFYNTVMKLILLGILGGGLFLFLLRAIRIWRNSADLAVTLLVRFLWSLAGGIMPSLYWWKYRISALNSEQRDGLLRKETETLNLGGPDNLICPLCGSEIEKAWTVTENGSVTVSKGPVSCPRCDFRLDSCRFCQHFLAGKPGAWGQVGMGGSDITFGRCSIYKKERPVDKSYNPAVVKKLKAFGISYVRDNLPIIDSYFPPDFCRAFNPDKKRMKSADVSWPNRKITALIKIRNDKQGRSQKQETIPDEEEKWLL
jgi:hypothetical protein